MSTTSSWQQLAFAAVLAGATMAAPLAAQNYDNDCNDTTIPPPQHDGHMETPAFAGDIVSADPQARINYIQSLCFLRSAGEKNHAFFRQGVKYDKKRGAIYPEYRALNITEDDLVHAGRVVAEVQVTTQNGGGAANGFDPFDEGYNYVYIDRDPQADDSNPWRMFIVNGSTGALKPLGKDKFKLVPSGRHPRSGAVVPPFSDASAKCNGASIRACHIDSRQIQNLERFADGFAKYLAAHDDKHLLSTDSLMGVELTKLLRAAVEIDGGNTGQWITLNGVCVCKGVGCHQ